MYANKINTMYCNQENIASVLSQMDMVIRYFIENKTYDVVVINIALDQYHLPLLGIA